MNAAILEDSIHRIDRLIEITKNDYHSKCPLSCNASMRSAVSASSSPNQATPLKSTGKKRTKQDAINERIRNNIQKEDDAKIHANSEQHTLPSSDDRSTEDHVDVPENGQNLSFYHDSAESLPSAKIRSNSAGVSSSTTSTSHYKSLPNLDYTKSVETGNHDNGNKTYFETPATFMDQHCPNCGAMSSELSEHKSAVSSKTSFETMKGRTDQSLEKLNAIDNISSTVDEKLEIYKLLVKNLLLERDACVELVLEQSEKIVSYEQKVQKFENLLEMEEKYNQCLETVKELENKLHVYELRENIYRQSFCHRRDSQPDIEESSKLFANQNASSISTNQMLQIVQQLQKVISEQGSEIQKLRSTFFTLT